MGELQDAIAGAGADLGPLLEDRCDIVTLERVATKAGGSKTTREVTPDIPCAFFPASNTKVERALGASVAPVSHSVVYLPLTQTLDHRQILIRGGVEYKVVALIEGTFEAFTRAYVTEVAG